MPSDAAAQGVPIEAMTVRPGDPVRDVVRRLKDLGDHAPGRLWVTTARGRLLGVVDTAQLRAMARADDLP